MLSSGAGAEESARAGVGWVVVESGSAPLTLPVAYRDEISCCTGSTATARPHIIAGYDRAHLIWLSALIVGAIGMGAVAFRHRRRRRTDGA